MMKKVLGIDIGGSGIKAAPVDVIRGVFLEKRHRIDTPTASTPAEVARVVDRLVRDFKWRGRVGVGFPGVIVGSTVLAAANLNRAWVGKDIVGLLQRTTGRTVRAINDADAAALAEMRFGAGKGKRGTVLLLTLGTGVGSALFRDGLLVPNMEFGHLPIRGKSAEWFVSSAARQRRELSWKDWGSELGAYLRTLEGLLWPELIILGGGVSRKHDKFFKYLKTRTPVVPAKLLNDAGIVGAALAGKTH